MAQKLKTKAIISTGNFMNISVEVDIEAPDELKGVELLKWLNAEYGGTLKLTSYEERMNGNHKELESLANEMCQALMRGESLELKDFEKISPYPELLNKVQAAKRASKRELPVEGNFRKVILER